MVKSFLAIVVLGALLAAGAVWYYHPDRIAGQAVSAEPADDEWLDHLYSSNPRDSAEAVRHVEMLGEDAVPIIREALQNPRADREHRRAALKACTILGEVAAPAIPEVSAELRKPDLTAEAALALSFMGRQAFTPLNGALDSSDPIVRREALRSIGKLKQRASLDTLAVVPILVSRLQDQDSGVRTVAATYLGIIDEEPDKAVPGLLAALEDPHPDVRRAAAEALGSFETAAGRVLPALSRATRDADPEVSREAGLAIVKLQAGR
jgi:HEAT repeat protein